MLNDYKYLNSRRKSEFEMNKRMVILGGGESGVGAALLAKQKGYGVFLSDGSSLKDHYRSDLQNAGVEFEEGSHTEEKILNAEEVMKSPGIPDKNEMVKKIKAKGIEIISEIELAYRFKGDSRIVGITGSNGKTTTTALTYHIFRKAGLDCGLVGNIGYSFARQVAEHEAVRLEGRAKLRLHPVGMLPHEQDGSMGLDPVRTGLGG